ncbi:MAG TPA: ABC transporter permease, partial [Bacteroidales bacterium]|nr:ABC transporter permease [Bacteroidales bacterium]
MIWKTAWKNVWRNKVRSLVVISSVTIGIFAGVFSVALMNGMIEQRVDDALNEEISDIQVTNRNFRLSNDPQLTIKDPSKVLTAIHSVKGVEATVERTVLTGMANTALKSTGVMITGIDPMQEKRVFTLYKKIIPGTGGYFDDKSEHNPIMIGEDLAKDLGIVRYYLDTSTVRNLQQKGVPEILTDKLKPVIGMRFTGEKQFVRKMKSLFSAKESKEYGQLIKKEAWTYRKNSRMTLTFLDKDNNQVGAMFHITGIYNIANSVFEKSMVFVRNSDLRRLTGLPDSACHEVVIK